MVLGRLFGRGKKDAGAVSASGATAGGATAGEEVAGAEPAAGDERESGGRFAALFRGLKKTRDRLASLLPFGRKLDAETLEEIETILIQSDFGPATALALAAELREAYKEREFSSEEIVPYLKRRLVERLGANEGIRWAPSAPTVIVVAGVNGTGKTTSIAKLAHLLHNDGKRVLLAAGDTFRAAAVEQLGIWSARIGVEMVRGADGGDPSAVVYTALERAAAESYDVVVIDTAGRLHTEKNLMNQLSKMVRVIQKKIPDAPHEVLQVLDATTGQNAIHQAAEFRRVMNVTGLILTKLDGTARGGVIFPILETVGLPVKVIGVGEGLEDLQLFDPESFVAALFD